MPDIKSVSRSLAVRVLILLLLTALIGVTLAMADDKDDKDVHKGSSNAKTHSFTGVWDTVAGGNYKYTLTLEQNGKQVTGAYTPGNGKVEGTVTGNVLRLRWTQDPDLKGSSRLVLSEDGQSFTGMTSTGDDPDVGGHAWNGTRHPSASFGGLWNLVSGGSTKYTLLLQQSGDKVTGLFTPGNGNITDGKIFGKTLRFKWSQDGGYKGSGKFDLADDGQSFSGSLDTSEGSTNGTPVSSIGHRPPVSFAGCWRLGGGGFMNGERICLKQDGERVTASWGDFEGTVIGNTLRFTHRPTGDHRTGHFIMDEGGKSFHGSYHRGDDPDLNEPPCTGTLTTDVPRK